MLEAILFDLDRTLVDVQSFTDYEAALVDARRLVGEWDSAETPDTDWDTATHRCMELLVSTSGGEDWNRLSTVIERHELVGVARSIAMPGLAEALRRTNEWPRMVVTLLPPDAARAALTTHGAGDLPVIGRRADLRPKPAPDQLILALEQLDVDPTGAVMIGDSSWDAAAAAAAGIPFVGVTNGAASVFPSTIDTAPDLAGALTLAGVAPDVDSVR